MRNPTTTEIQELVTLWLGDDSDDVGVDSQTAKQNRRERRHLAAAYRQDPALYWRSRAQYESGGEGENPEGYKQILEGYLADKEQ